MKAYVTKSAGKVVHVGIPNPESDVTLEVVTPEGATTEEVELEGAEMGDIAPHLKRLGAEFESD